MGRRKKAPAEPAEGKQVTEPAADGGQEQSTETKIEFTGAKVLEALLEIDLEDIDTTRFNVRQVTVDSPGIRDLADSMERQGQLVPVIIRTSSRPGPGVELIAGHRRYFARVRAVRENIRATLVEATDEQAQLISITENLKRQNLTPMEEAATIQKLLDAGMTRKRAASVLGWSEKKVSLRARLLELIDEWREAMAGRLPIAVEKRIRQVNRWGPLKPGHFTGWTADHLELIARYPAEKQLDILVDLWTDSDASTCTPEDLAGHLANNMKLLKQAPWKLDDDSLVPQAGACNACPKRTGANPGLFDDDPTPGKVGATDKCLDERCWVKKTQAHKERKLAEARAENPDILLITESYGQTDGMLNRNQYEVGKKDWVGAVEAVVADGEGLGIKRWIRLNNKGTRDKAARPKGPDGKPKETPIKVRMQRHQDRRNAIVVRAIREILSSKKLAEKILLNHPKECDRKLFALAVVAAFGTSKNRSAHYNDGASWKRLDELAADVPELIENITCQVAPVLFDRIAYLTCEDATKQIPEARKVCQLMSIDFSALEKKAAEELPWPKAYRADAEKLEGSAPQTAEKKPAAKKYSPPEVKVKRTAKASGTCCHGTPIGTRCPECNTPLNEMKHPATPKRKKAIKRVSKLHAKGK